MFTLTCPVSRPVRDHRARDHGAHHHGRDGRSPLVLAAALAVAVPGFLVAACSGQAGSSAAQNDAVAARAATGGKVPVAGRRPGTVLAVRLLAQAAQAAIVTSYQGEEVVTRWSQGTDGSVLVSDVWHVSGGQTVTQTLDAGASSSSQPYLSSDDDGQAPEGVLGVTVPLVQLLETHYVVAYAGASSADDRTAQVVEARRADGSLAAQVLAGRRDQAAARAGGLRHRRPRDQPGRVHRRPVRQAGTGAGRRRRVGRSAGTVDRPLLAGPAARAAGPRLAGPGPAARRPLAVHRRRDGGEYRHRA